MQTRSEQTRQALVRATAELIAEGRVHDAGLVNICRRAGVSRGALYHHFSSTTELTAAVYDQARSRLVALMDEAFEASPTVAPERFFVALGAAMRTQKTVRAGIQLAADGTDARPSLRDELLALVHQRVVEAYEESVVPSAQDLADLTVVVAAGIESLGHADPAWWEVKASQRLWEMLRPLFSAARGRRA
ncbi:TetR family transcriptional regulator [Streptomyces sp. NPDC014846]|uniref:TetR family transcriptional regulator n=1 Tax=unclassified Streptomyces TaxID=2593676 RepID=UPI003700BF1C